MGNYGDAILSVELYDVSSGATLASTRMIKKSAYPTIQNEALTVSYDNKTSSSQTVSLRLRG